MLIFSLFKQVKYLIQWRGDHCRVITVAVSSLCLAVVLGSAIITGDLPHPAKELGMSDIVGNLAVTLFVVGFGLGVSLPFHRFEREAYPRPRFVQPLVYAPMSEMFGRRPIYIISMGLFASKSHIHCALSLLLYIYRIFSVWTIPCALAKNPQTLLVGRALAGLAASAPMTNVGGSVADLWSLGMYLSSLSRPSP